MQTFPAARKINKTRLGKFICSVRGSNTAHKVLRYSLANLAMHLAHPYRKAPV